MTTPAVAARKTSHFARDRDLARDKSCFNCGQPGHSSCDYPEPRKHRGGHRACHKCVETDHIARERPTGEGGAGDGACHNCGGVGHFARECTASGFGNAPDSRGSGMKCFKCAQYGHKSSECTNERVAPEHCSEHRTCNKFKLEI